MAPALIRAVEGHKDQYVRFRALVLLTAFNDPRTADLIHGIVEQSKRSRTDEFLSLSCTAASSNAEHDSRVAQIAQRESRSLRPALVRALAAQNANPRVRKALLADLERGQDFLQERGHRGGW